MADIVWDDVVALQANLSTIASAAQDLILAYVNTSLNPSAFGGEDSARYELARIYLAAHLGELTRRNGAQNVSAEAIDVRGIQLQYAAINAGGNAHYETSWGAQYATLVRQSPLRIGGGRTR